MVRSIYVDFVVDLLFFPTVKELYIYNFAS